MIRFNKNIIIVFILFLFSLSVFGQDKPVFSINLKNVDGKSFNLNKPLWKYHAGDNLAWASLDFNDTEWKTVNPGTASSENALDGWNGNGWFRAHIDVDESLIGQPVSAIFWNVGASEIYLDGKLLQEFGDIMENDDREYSPQGMPVPMVFSKSGEHILAVRYSFQSARDTSGGIGKWLAQGFFSPGFYSFLQTSFDAQYGYNQRQLEQNEYKLFSGILFALGFLHFLLFVFYPREKANVYYSVFAFCLATGNTLSSLYNNSHQSALITALTFVFFVVFYSASFIALLAFLYVAFSQRFSKFFWFLCGYLAVLTVFMAIYSRAEFTLYIVVGLMLLSIGDALRIIFQALKQKRTGAPIIMAGVGVFTIGVLMLLARELEIINWTGTLEQARNVALYLAIPIAVSIYLARNFAQINRNLEAKLVEVELFSEKEIEHEKQQARLLIVEAENERRAKELEEARNLQLSMLPKKLPNLPNLEIAAYMKPATEVGGDYYDFHISADGTLTVAVGDATGHGLKAGSVVTATKSLFNAFAEEPHIPNIFKRSNLALKSMNLRGLFMALAILKIKDNQVSLSSAGMPSVLVYRSNTKTVDEILIKAMPLGSVKSFPYQNREFDLSVGDCILIMSDGFPEMFNPKNEMIGFEEAASLLPEIAGKSAQEIVNHLIKVGEDWAQERPADDDVTFVVLKAV